MGKLVRDKIPDIIRNDGKKPITRILQDDEYLAELKKKAVEEAKEFEAALTKENMVEELADQMEVILACLKAIDVSAEKLEEVRLQKSENKGGFSKRIFWEGNE